MMSRKRFGGRIVSTIVVTLALSIGLVMAVITNGGFELGKCSGWTITTYLNPGLSGSGPTYTGANIVRNTGGINQSVILGPLTAETGVDPQLGAAATLKYPKFGSFAARVNGTNRPIRTRIPSSSRIRRPRGMSCRTGESTFPSRMLPFWSRTGPAKLCGTVWPVRALRFRGSGKRIREEREFA